MTGPHFTEDDGALVAYLYDECDAEERRRIERHLAECAQCASEVREIRSVREALAGWTPPTVRLGFRVVADPPASMWRRAAGSLPVWAQAAAAVLLFAAGAAVAQLDVRSGSEGLTISTRWAHPAIASGQTPPGDQTAGAAVRTREPAGVEAAGPGPVTVSHPTGSSDVSAVAEQMLRQDLAAAPQPGTAAAPAQGDEALLRRVQALIEQSERRQQRELALRLAQVVRDVDAQRRADLLRVDQNLGQLEGQTGAAAAQQRELLNYLVRVSQQP
jgi:hypothetical protein